MTTTSGIEFRLDTNACIAIINQRTPNAFLAYLQVLPFTDAQGDEAAAIRIELEREGIPIGPFDTLIAAHARSIKATLVTHNTREFARVPGLTVTDWKDA